MGEELTIRTLIKHMNTDITTTNSMEDNKYFSHRGLSKSQIKHYDPRNPMAFWKQCVFNPNKQESANTDYTVTGKLSHMLTFERDRVMDNFVVVDGLGKMRKNIAWQKAQALEKKLIISTEELNQATLMADALSKHESIRNLLKYAKVEAPYMWYDKEWGIDFKMRTDAETGSEEGLYCIDLKTTAKEFPQYIDKGDYQYEIGIYSRGLRHKYGKPLQKFIYIFQSTNEGEENDIRLKVVEGPHLEACAIETDCIVKQIVPKIKSWQSSEGAEVKESLWLPEVVVESFEISPWYKSKGAC